MIREINTGSIESVLDETFTGGLGKLVFSHPAGTFAVTPASRILFEAIIKNKNILHGTGIDWGSGVGCQAILAAKIDAVDAVYGLEIAQDNVDTAIKNAKENGVENKVRFIAADSYTPFHETEKQTINTLKGNVDFILSNPPSSDWDDGFGFRRIVLEGAKDFLKENGVVFLNVSFQYGMERIKSLERIDGFRHMGVIASTECVPFDLTRADLLDCLKIYAAEEKNGGVRYTFIKDENDQNNFIDASTALALFEKSGKSPYTKWQTHLFRYGG